MATTPQDFPPRVSLFTNYDKKTVEILVSGKNGDLSLEVYQDGPLIVIKDPDRGPMKLKAMCMLKANGHIRGGFASPDSQHLIWFPVKKPRKRPAKRQQTKQ